MLVKDTTTPKLRCYNTLCCIVNLRTSFRLLPFFWH